jgi:hypothetical protein
MGANEGLWDCLYRRGVVSRSFNSKRFAWIRRFLSGAGPVDVHDPTYVIGERAAKWRPSEKFWTLASSLDTGGEGGQDFTETPAVDDPLDCWEKGVPLVLAGITTEETAERRRMAELVEAIVCQKVWNLAAGGAQRKEILRASMRRRGGPSNTRTAYRPPDALRRIRMRDRRPDGDPVVRTNQAAETGVAACSGGDDRNRTGEDTLNKLGSVSVMVADTPGLAGGLATPALRPTRQKGSLRRMMRGDAS